MKNEIKQRFQNYDIITGFIEKNGIERPSLLIKKDAPKSKFGFKVIENYWFPTPEKRSDHIAKFMSALEKRKAEQEARKQVKKEAYANLVNPFKVGQIFYDSWGYEQTNIDFYQVVEVKKKSVVIRGLAEKITQPGAHYLSEYVVAIPDDFISDPIEKRIQMYINSDGKPVVYIKSKYGWMSEWDGRPKYQSHYA